MSRSPSPRRSYAEPGKRRPRSAGLSQSPAPNKDSSLQDRRYTSISQTPPPPRANDLEKKRRRDSVSSVDSYISQDKKENTRPSRERGNSRSTRRRFQQVSPPVRGRNTESRSPRRGRGRVVDDREQNRDKRNGGPHDGPPRERSLSPFSKRLALTQAMSIR